MPDLACIDGIRVGQVISNLLNNAVKFTEAGAIAIQVDYEDDRLAFRIRDTGIGIALEQQRTLFIPFKQVESDTNSPVWRHRARACHLSSTHPENGEPDPGEYPGMGTCVTFTLPLAECQWEAPLTGQVWWWFGEDEGLESVMARLGARLVRMEAHHWQQPSRGICWRRRITWSRPLAVTGWPVCSVRNLKGIVLSPHEALRSAWVVTPGGDWDNRLSIPICCWKPASHCSTSRRASRWGWRGEAQGRVLVADDHPVNRALLTRQLCYPGAPSPRWWKMARRRCAPGRGRTSPCC